MVVIRLKRIGTKNRAAYRIVAMDRHSPRDGRFIEELGSYDPHKEKPDKVALNGERLSYWLSKGAVPSAKVKAFLNEFGLISADKVATK